MLVVPSMHHHHASMLACNHQNAVFVQCSHKNISFEYQADCTVDVHCLDTTAVYHINTFRRRHLYRIEQVVTHHSIIASSLHYVLSFAVGVAYHSSLYANLSYHQRTKHTS